MSAPRPHDRRLSYENKRVAYILNYVLPDERDRLGCVEALRKEAWPYLTFDALYRAGFIVPYRMPVYFNVGYVGGRDEYSGSYWLNLAKSRLIEYYFARRKATRNRLGNAQLNFAYVVNMPTVRGGLVIHTLTNAPREKDETVIQGTCLNEDLLPETVIVQPYNSFARWVATRWLRDQPLSLPRRPSNTELLREMPANAVLLLVHLEERYICDGLITTTHEALATRCGMGHSTVQRSLKTLSDHGLIETERGENCVHIRIM